MEFYVVYVWSLKDIWRWGRFCAVNSTNREGSDITYSNPILNNFNSRHSLPDKLVSSLVWV